MTGNPRSLSGLHKTLPIHDRNDEALLKLPLKSKQPGYAKYVHWDKMPQDLAELHAACTPFGDSSVKEAVWGGISRWMMNNVIDLPDIIPRAAGLALSLCQASDRLKGYPNLSGIVRIDEISLLSEASQAEAWSVSHQVKAEWERIGQPYLGASISSTYQTIRAYRRMTAEQDNRTTN